MYGEENASQVSQKSNNLDIMPVLGDAPNRTGSSLGISTNVSVSKKNQRYMYPTTIKDIKVTRKILME